MNDDRVVLMDAYGRPLLNETTRVAVKTALQGCERALEQNLQWLRDGEDRVAKTKAVVETLHRQRDDLADTLKSLYAPS